MNVPGCFVVLSLMLLMKLKGTCSIKCFECFSDTYSSKPCLLERDRGYKFCYLLNRGELNLSVADCCLFVF